MKKELRNFGLIWALIFMVLAFLPILKGHEIRIWALEVSLVFLAISLIYPQIYSISKFYQNWIKFGNFLGKINSKIIIAALFYLIFFPIALIIKISGKDLLNKKIDKSKTSYFIDENQRIIDMKNQF